MSFICAAMSGVGAIVQAKRERERERLRPGRSENSPAAGGGVKKSWAGLPHIVRRQGAGGCWPGVRSRRQGVSQNRD